MWLFLPCRQSVSAMLVAKETFPAWTLCYLYWLNKKDSLRKRLICAWWIITVIVLSYLKVVVSCTLSFRLSCDIGSKREILIDPLPLRLFYIISYNIVLPWDVSTEERLPKLSKRCNKLSHIMRLRL